MLDQIGLIGGLYFILQIIVSFISAYFSAKLFLQAVANTMYLNKEQQLEEEEQEYEGGKKDIKKSGSSSSNNLEPEGGQSR